MASNGVDALIVGAGPVGLTMAAALERQGVRCRIIDKAATPSDKSKALVVWSRTLELLQGLGLTETFIASGLKIDGASVYHNGERAVHIQIAGVETPYPFPLMIPQSDTERLLGEYLASRGIVVERQVELVGFNESGASVSCTLQKLNGSRESLDVPWLIGCDGAHSTVRHTLGMEFTGVAEPNDWILADIHLTGPIAKNEISVYWHAKGVLVFFPITHDRFRMVADLGAASVEKRPEPTLADAQAKADERGPGGIVLSDPVWIANFRINERKVSDYRRGRVMLAGDAAHIHSPAGGQGMNTGMQDAFNLAWKLGMVVRGSGKTEPLLTSYSQERSAVGDEVLHAVERLTTVATLRNRAAQFVRNHVAPIITSFGFVQDRIKNAMCELSINYRGGPMSAEDWPLLGGGVPAGDRMPEFELVSATTGEKTSLFAEMRSDRWMLLAIGGANGEWGTGNGGVGNVLALIQEVKRKFGDWVGVHLVIGGEVETPCADSTNVRVWRDSSEAIHERLGAKSTAVYLLRPDGYVGYRGMPADAAKVCAYLSKFLVDAAVHY